MNRSNWSSALALLVSLFAVSMLWPVDSLADSACSALDLPLGCCECPDPCKKVEANGVASCTFEFCSTTSCTFIGDN